MRMPLLGVIVTLLLTGCAAKVNTWPSETSPAGAAAQTPPPSASVEAPPPGAAAVVSKKIIVLNLSGSSSATGSADWERLKAEWHKGAIADQIVQEIGGR